MEILAPVVMKPVADAVRPITKPVFDIVRPIAKPVDDVVNHVADSVADTIKILKWVDIFGSMKEPVYKPVKRPEVSTDSSSDIPETTEKPVVKEEEKPQEEEKKPQEETPQEEKPKEEKPKEEDVDKIPENPNPYLIDYAQQYFFLQFCIY